MLTYAYSVSIVEPRSAEGDAATRGYLQWCEDWSVPVLSSSLYITLPCCGSPFQKVLDIAIARACVVHREDVKERQEGIAV